MINKEYLDKLKEEDYIAWDSVVNDSMVTGGGSNDALFGCMMFIGIVGFILLGVLIGKYLL